jgi:hypothetical protein
MARRASACNARYVAFDGAWTTRRLASATARASSRNIRKSCARSARAPSYSAAPFKAAQQAHGGYVGFIAAQLILQRFSLHWRHRQLTHAGAQRVFRGVDFCRRSLINGLGPFGRFAGRAPNRDAGLVVFPPKTQQFRKFAPRRRMVRRAGGNIAQSFDGLLMKRHRVQGKRLFKTSGRRHDGAGTRRVPR